MGDHSVLTPDASTLMSIFSKLTCHMNSAVPEYITNVEPDRSSKCPQVLTCQEEEEEGSARGLEEKEAETIQACLYPFLFARSAYPKSATEAAQVKGAEVSGLFQNLPSQG